MSLLKKLKKIRKKMEKKYGEEGFPLNFCFNAAGIIHYYLGFEMVRGYVKGDLRHLHCWNYDPVTENYIDITLDQFKPFYYLGPITIIPKNSELAKKIYE